METVSTYYPYRKFTPADDGAIQRRRHVNFIIPDSLCSTIEQDRTVQLRILLEHHLSTQYLKIKIWLMNQYQNQGNIVHFRGRIVAVVFLNVLNL